MADAHITRIVPRSRARGKVMPANFLPTIDSESLAVTRYPARTAPS